MLVGRRAADGEPRRHRRAPGRARDCCRAPPAPNRSARLVQERDQPNVRTYIGKGKVDELSALCQQRRSQPGDLRRHPDAGAGAQSREDARPQRHRPHRADPRHLRAPRAHARGASSRSSWRSSQYMRPRLKQLWDHLSRQDGGIGTRGPGETQLEADRRKVEREDRAPEAALARSAHGGARRSARGVEATFRAALVGYTNAGKSSLLNALAGTDAARREQAVLDARRHDAPGDAGRRDARRCVTDTVGFIRKLPHDLVASFRTTLEEINAADLDPARHRRHEHEPRGAHGHRERGVGRDPRRPARHDRGVQQARCARRSERRWRRCLRHHEGAIATSARTGEGLDVLRDAIGSRVETRLVDVQIVATQGRPRGRRFLLSRRACRCITTKMKPGALGCACGSPRRAWRRLRDHP